MSFRLPKLIAFFLACALMETVSAQLPQGFRDELVSDDWEGAVGIEFVDSSHWLVWERAGRIWLVEKGIKASRPILDLNVEILGSGEHGLLSILPHPNFRSNGYLFLAYAVDPWVARNPNAVPPEELELDQWDATIGRLTRYQVDFDTWTTTDTSRQVLIGSILTDGIPLLSPSHGIGGMAWGADGSLLLATGDGTTWVGDYTGGTEYREFGYDSIGKVDGIIKASEDLGAYRSQFLNSYSGKVLRIDPMTGLGLRTNPFYDEEKPDQPASKVWSLGLRNPFRILRVPESGSTADGDPGSLIIGDVGRHFYEEINVADGPANNFGWPAFEGFIPLLGFQEQGIVHPLAKEMFPQVDCPDLFRFDSLLRTPTLDHSQLIIYQNDTLPPNQTIVALSHSPPILAYGNTKNSPEETYVPVVDHAGNSSYLSIDDPSAGVMGASFDGITSVAGDFYKGSSWPKEYHGKYFHADFSGWIKMFEIDQHTETEVHKAVSFSDSERPTVFLKFNKHDDCLYYVVLNYSSDAPQEIRRICFGGNAPPIAQIDLPTIYGSTPITFQLDGRQSSDAEGALVSYTWVMDGDTLGDEDHLSLHFTEDLDSLVNQEIMLEVVDSGGLSDVASITLSLNNTPPSISITSPLSGLEYHADGEVLDLLLKASVSDLEHSDSQLVYCWDIFLDHNNHSHLEFTVSDTSHHFFLQTPPETPFATYSYRVHLAVTDPLGLTGSDEVVLRPRTTSAITRENDHFSIYPNPSHGVIRVNVLEVHRYS